MSCQNDSQCQNGGLCGLRDVRNGSCNCNAGWTGEHCESKTFQTTYSAVAVSCGGGGGGRLPQCMLGYTPLGVGLETPKVWAWRPPGCGPGDPQVRAGRPPRVWAWRPPGCGPGDQPGCGPGDQPGCGPGDPPGVGLDTPWPDPSTSPWVWAWRLPPPARPLKFHPGCWPQNLQGMLGYTPHPRDLQGMLGYHLQGMLGYPPPPRGQNS